MKDDITPEMQEAICRLIRSGSYPHVAAEFAGLPRRVFTRWMRKRGEKYRRFRQAIRAAEAEARVSAETRVLDRNPLAWLKYGPGKEKEEAGRGRIDRRTRRLLARILHALEPYPEARALVAEVLADPARQKDGQQITTDGGEVTTP